jgi:hypothetical protein
MRHLLAVLVVLIAPGSALAAERLLIDFGQPQRPAELDRQATDELISRFPSLMACHYRPSAVVAPARVTHVAGSFTRSGARETAMLIDYCPGGIDRPRRFLVFDGSQLVLDQAMIEAGDELLLASDLTGDGLDELVLLHGQSATLVQLGKDRMKKLGSFSSAEPCAAGKKQRIVHTLYVTPGKRPTFRDELERVACNALP